MKRTFKILSSLATLLVIFGSSSFFGSLAYAQGADANAVRTQGLANGYGLIALAAGLGIGIAALGGGIGQGRATAAALDGIARNPGAAGQVRGAMILGLALIESLVIYALIIAFILAFKVGA